MDDKQRGIERAPPVKTCVCSGKKAACAAQRVNGLGERGRLPRRAATQGGTGGENCQRKRTGGVAPTEADPSNTCLEAAISNCQ